MPDPTMAVHLGGFQFDNLDFLWPMLVIVAAEIISDLLNYHFPPKKKPHQP